MAVSLTQVQAPLSGLPNGGGQGQLTLTILNKTDYLIAQLKALDASRVHRVEVVKALVNGRAEVQVGGLRLDVKASLPLKTGENFQLKFEQVGNALRFVQPLRPDGGAQKGAARQGAEQPAQPSHLLQGGKANVTPEARPLGQPPVHRTPPADGAQLATGTKRAERQIAGQQGAGGASLAGARPGPGGHSFPPQNTLTQKAVVQKTLTQETLTQKTLGPNGQHQTGQGGPTIKAHAPPSGGLGHPLSPLPGPVAPTALLRAAATLLPALQEEAGLLKSSSHAPGRPVASPGQAVAQGKSENLHQGQLASFSEQGEAQLAKVSKASEVSARYQLLTSNNGDPSSDSKAALLRPADVTLSLALTPERPFMVGFYLDDDQGAETPPEQGRGFGLRFHFESEAVGSIFAEMALIDGQLRLSLWAGRAEMAETLSQNQAGLKERLETRGLAVVALSVRHGEGPPEYMQDARLHVDEEI